MLEWKDPAYYYLLSRALGATLQYVYNTELEHYLILLLHHIYQAGLHVAAGVKTAQETSMKFTGTEAGIILKVQPGLVLFSSRRLVFVFGQDSRGAWHGMTRPSDGDVVGISLNRDVLVGLDMRRTGGCWDGRWFLLRLRHFGGFGRVAYLMPLAGLCFGPANKISRSVHNNTICKGYKVKGLPRVDDESRQLSAG